MKKLFALLLTCLASSALAQDGPNHAMPVFGGAGFVGFRAAGPCAAGQALVYSSATADPTCAGVPTVVTVTSFGAVCDGSTNDATAIQNAINSLPVDGGIVLFPAQNCKINSTITVGNGTASAVSTRKGVILQGLAPPGANGTPFFNGYATITGPKLTWGGGASSSMISINGPLKGWGVQNLLLDCASASNATGLNVSSAGYGDSFNLSITNCPGASISSNANPLGGYTGVGNVDSIRNNWNTIDIVVPATVGAKGILLNGDTGGTSNTDYNTFTNIFIRINGNANPNYGLYFGVSDSNVFTSLNISGGGANTVNVAYDYSLNTSFPNGNLIYGVDSNGTGIQWQNIGAPANTINNYVFGISQANGGTFPNLQNLSVFASGEIILAGSTSGRTTIVPPAVAGTPTLTAPTSTGTLTESSVTTYATSGILYGTGTSTLTNTDRCTMDSNQSIVCTSATTSLPQYNMTNSTADATGSFFIFNKNRTGGNSNSGDTLGQFRFNGFANSAINVGAQIDVSQAAASSGNNVPTRISLRNSNAAGQFNQVMAFDQNAHLAIATQATAPTVTAGCNGAGVVVGTGSTDTHGTITGQTAAATTCTLTFGTAFASTPHCVASGQTSPLTGTFTPSTTTLVVNFGSTANYKWSYVCFGG